MASPKDKKKIKGFKEFDSSKYIDVEPTLDEATMKDSVVVSFGRMNPVTVGHEKLVSKVTAEASKRKADGMVFMSHSQDAKKNPLSYDDKVKFAKKAFGSVVQKSNSRTIIDIAKSLTGKYKNFVMVVGSDRVDEFKKLLNTYNGKDFNFDSIEVVSAGARDPDAEGVEGMSASKMRSLASDGNVKEFTKGLPKRLQSSAASIMAAVRKGMNMTEEVELDEALNRMQRRKRALAMKKARFKIKRGREKAARKTASQDVLKKRAKKAALNIFKQKFAKNRRYAELSSGEKEVIDKRIEKISKKRIESIARKLLPKVKQKERDRRASKAASQNESLQEASYKDQRVLKRPHMLIDGNKKTKLDARFKMFKKKDMNESVENLTEELAELMEATEQFNEGEKKGLWANIHAKRKRIKAGSGEKMRKPGSKGAPTDDALKAAAESVEIDEAVDKSSDVYKEYLELKKKSIKELRDMIKRTRRVVDVSGYDKQGAISDILRSRHGNRKVAAAMGLDEATFKVDIEGLPSMFIDAESAPQVKKTLRQMLKKPDDKIKGVDRVQPAEVKKHFRLKALGKDEEQMNEESGAGEEGTNKLVKKYKKDTPAA